MWNGQSNALAVGLLLLAAAAVVRRRWWIGRLPARRARAGETDAAGAGAVVVCPVAAQADRPFRAGARRRTAAAVRDQSAGRGAASLSRLAGHLFGSSSERWPGFRDAWTVWLAARHLLFGAALVLDDPMTQPLAVSRAPTLDGTRRAGVVSVAAAARRRARVAGGADVGDGVGVADAVRPCGGARDLCLPGAGAGVGRGAALRLGGRADRSSCAALVLVLVCGWGGAAALLARRKHVAAYVAAAGHGTVRRVAVRLRRDATGPRNGRRKYWMVLRAIRTGYNFRGTCREFAHSAVPRSAFGRASDMTPAGTTYESHLLLTLEEISQLVSHSHDPAETLANIVRLIQGRFHTAVCSVYLLEPERGELVLGATVGLKPESVGQVRMRLDEGLTGLVAEQMAPVMVADAFQHPRFKYFPEAGEDPYHSFLGVPLVEGGALQGVLVVQTVEPRTFSAERDPHAGHGGRPAGVAGRRRPACSNASPPRRTSRAELARRRTLADAQARTLQRGVGLSPGIGVGQAYVVDGFDEWRHTVAQTSNDPARERARLAQAMDGAREEIVRLSQHISELVGEDHGAILQAQLMIMQDRTIEQRSGRLPRRRRQRRGGAARRRSTSTSPPSRS